MSAVVATQGAMATVAATRGLMPTVVATPGELACSVRLVFSFIHVDLFFQCWRFLPSGAGPFGALAPDGSAFTAPVSFRYEANLFFSATAI